MDKKINILIRTHRRPVKFKRLLDSIASQTYKNYEIFVSVDDDLTYQYVKENGIGDAHICHANLYYSNDVSVEKSICEYNRYFNRLIEMVEDGYIYCIDDDDYLMDKYVLEHISTALLDNALTLFRMHAFGKLIPSYSFGREITVGDIGIPCFCVHSKHAKLVEWSNTYTADGEFIKDIEDKVEMVIWSDLVACMVETNNKGRSEL